jgi:hypothetical protein
MRLTRSLAKQAGSPTPPEQFINLPPMQMSDEGTFVFDRKRGLMREVKVNRRVSVGPNRRLDAWEIRSDRRALRQVSDYRRVPF